MLVHIKKIIKDAEKHGYAVGAFNINNLEILQAVLRAAEKMKSPVIVQTTEGALKYAGLEEIAALVKAAADEVKVPVALHLDHGSDLKTVKACVEEGYSSVMIDGSAFPYRKNVEITKEVVSFAKKKKVWVQGELGRLEGSEDWVKTNAKQAFLTEPLEAEQFVKETGINTLAVAIGNYHGVKKIIEKKPLKLDLKRLEKIDKLVPVPLVLHGASGFSDKQIKEAVKHGVRVVNIDSELRISFTKAERKFLKANKDVFDPRKILTPAIEAMQKVVERKIRVLGSRNRA